MAIRDTEHQALTGKCSIPTTSSPFLKELTPEPASTTFPHTSATVQQTKMSTNMDFEFSGLKYEKRDLWRMLLTVRYQKTEADANHDLIIYQWAKNLS